MALMGSLATWYFWAFYAAGIFIMGSTLAVHLLTTQMPGFGPWLIVVSAYCGVVGAAIGGMQAGPYPMFSAAYGVAVIRLFWVTGISLGVVASGMYLFSKRERVE